MRATKESGVEWLTEIPSDWSVRPVWTGWRRVKRTGNPDEELLSVYRDHGVIPKSSRDDNFNVESEDLNSYQLVNPGDLVMNKMKAWQGSIALSSHRGIVSPAYFVYEPLEAGDAKFHHYLLRSAPYIAEYNRISKGVRVGQWDLDPIHFRTTPLLVPPVEEQRAIAEFLDRETAQIDNLIAKQEQLIATLGERRTALIRESISMGLKSDAERRWSGVDWLGDIPDHWRAMPLKWCAKLQTGSTPKDEVFSDNETAPWLRPDDLDETGIPSSATRYFSAQAVAALPPARAGATLLCGIGATLGKVGLVAEKVYFNQQITSVTSKARDKFMFYVLLAAKGELKALSVGNTLQILNNERLGSLMVPLPPDNEQDSIVEHLDRQTGRIDRLVSASSQAVTLLQERRQALISAAVTGKIDVRG